VSFDKHNFIYRDDIGALTAWTYWISIVANMVLSYFAIAHFVSGSGAYKVLLIANSLLLIASMKLTKIYKRQQIHAQSRKGRLLQIRPK
jgi:hypothetical protein